PAFDGSNNPLLILPLFFWQIEQFSQLHKVGHERLTGGRPYPEHVSIFVVVAKGVFGCGLRFADTAESIERLGLGQGSSSRYRETLMKQGQQGFATCEEWVACNGNVRYPGSRPWWQQDDFRKRCPGIRR